MNPSIQSFAIVVEIVEVYVPFNTEMEVPTLPSVVAEEIVWGL